MIFKYRVSLPGLKGFARVYEVKSSASLYSFHKQMMADMDFPQDQIVLFKAVNESGSPLAKYASVDLGWGTIDSITLGQCHKKGLDSFVYFYDTTNAKSVLVNFEGEGVLDPLAVYPALIEVKGPNPIEFENGYVAFEDRPKDEDRRRGNVRDDDDFDDDDDEDDDELEDDDSPEEIYDESEDE